uniref:Uncharacterized protein n=1 Tax=Eubacterium cellulosolvens (strain ATCC 43171 / JCM 9499 / 6) TaxID=633697 RepID=I5AXN7_EUBC6
MFGMFISESIGALVQLLLFSLIPLIFWLVFARKKQNFLNWLGIKRSIMKEKGWLRHVQSFSSQECI